MIVINDSNAIRSDENQWILCVRVMPSKSRSDGWRSRKFCTSLGILLRTSSYSWLADIEHNAHEISAMINARLEYGKEEG
jgi:hypothetical protein